MSKPELLEDILRGISDDRLLVNRREEASPLGDLIDSYKKASQNNDNLETLNSDWTGRDLKEAIKKVPSDEQLTMLYKYMVAVKSPGDPFSYAEHPREADERRHRHWIVKTAVVSAILMTFAIIGAVIALAVSSGQVEKGVMVDTFMSTALEILKLVFSMDNGAS